MIQGNIIKKFGHLDTINQSQKLEDSNGSTLSVSARSMSPTKGLMSSEAQSSLKRHYKEKNKYLIGPDKDILAPQHKLLVMRPSNLVPKSTNSLYNEVYEQ